MDMRKQTTIFWFSLLIFLAGLPVLAKAAGLNAGFVNGIWYSALPLQGGEEVRIYTAVQNQSEFDIIGKVQFFDGETLIGQSDFSVPNGSLGQSWVDWKVTAGTHQIRAKIVDAKKCEIGKEPVAIDFESSSFIDVQYAKPEPPKPPAPTENPAESPAENPAPKDETKNWFSSLFGSPSGSENKSEAVSGAMRAPVASLSAAESSVSTTETGFFAAAIDKLEAAKERVEQKILKAEELEKNNKKSASRESSAASSATGSLNGVLEEMTVASSFDKAYAGLLGAAIFVMKWRWIFTIGTLMVVWILWRAIGTAA